MSLFDKLFRKNKNNNETVNEQNNVQSMDVQEEIIEEVLIDEQPIEQDIENPVEEAATSNHEEVESTVETDNIKEIDNVVEADNALETDKEEACDTELNDETTDTTLYDEAPVVEDVIVEEESIETVEEELQYESTEEITEEPKKKKGLFSKIKEGLNKTRNNIISGVENVLKSFVKIDEDLFEELEEALIMSDIGVETSVAIIDELREQVKANKITEVSEVRQTLIEVISNLLQKDETSLELPSPTVILVIGVNGVGKTTTIGKLAHNYKTQGKSVLLAAADTFRAAAIDQLEVWAKRNDVDIIKHQENSDPGAVVFDAVQAAKSRKTDILICDTAGRLHNKKNLMEELRKIARIINKEFENAHLETFLVLDATTGQNAVQQAKLFNEVADITGIVLTKLDGTAKGGIILAIKNEMNIPVRYIGVGEGLDDLQPFNSDDFAKALFDEEDSE